MHLQAVASAFLIVFLCQHNALVSALLGRGNGGLLGNTLGGGNGGLLGNTLGGGNGGLLGKKVKSAGQVNLQGVNAGVLEEVKNAILGNSDYLGLSVDELLKMSQCLQTLGKPRNAVERDQMLALGSDVLSNYQGQIPSAGPINPELLEVIRNSLEKNPTIKATGLKPEQIPEYLQCLQTSSQSSNNMEIANQLAASRTFFNQNSDLGSQLLNTLSGALNSLGTDVSNLGGKVNSLLG